MRAILDNPRYTGYAFFGRWTKQEVLLNPDDVAAGHAVRFRRAATQRVVRSRHPAHPAIISVQEFTQAQLQRKAKAAGGNRGQAKSERTRAPERTTYVLAGLIRCDLCNRKMHAAPVRKRLARLPDSGLRTP